MAISSCFSFQAIQIVNPQPDSYVIMKKRQMLMMLHFLLKSIACFHGTHAKIRRYVDA